MTASQLGNTNASKKLIICGKEYTSIRAAAKNLGINYSTLRYKIKQDLI
jgi:molybdenum-dependent DNA-binding transcriptional regulator ModE